MICFLCKDGTRAMMAGKVVGEIKPYTAANGNTKISFGIQVGYTQESGGEFVNCEVWNPIAEKLSGMKKGDVVFGFGKRRDYEGRDGKARSSWTLEFATQSFGESAEQSQPEQPKIPDALGNAAPVDDDDDLPF